MFSFSFSFINRYIFIILLIVVANVVGKYFKKHFLTENNFNEDNDMIKKYLLNDSPLPGFNKPKLWIHTKYEINARKWLDFSSRNSKNLNMPYIHLTIKTIVEHNSEDFHICLIDDETFSKLIPKWDINIPSSAEPMKSYFRELGMVKLLSLYGGMFVPDSFVCSKPLKPFYDDNTSGNMPFVCENINRTVNMMKQKQKSLFIPSTYFMGSPKNNGTMIAFFDFLKSQVLLPDFSGERLFLGDTSQWCLGAISKNKMNLVLGQRVGVKTVKRKPL